MAATTLDVFDAFLKDYYMRDWVDQLTSKTTVVRLMRRSTVDWAGDQLIIPIRTGRNWGIGAIATSAGGSLPTLLNAGYQGVARTTADARLITGALQLSQDTIDKSKNDRAAFFRALDFEMRGLVDDMTDYTDYLANGRGTGYLATITATPAATTMNVDNHFPFFVGMRIECWDGETAGADASTFAASASGHGTSGTQGNVQIVEEIVRNDDGSGVVTVNSTTGAANAYILARAGARLASTAGYEPYGIYSLISASNPPCESSLQGIDRTATGNSYWQAYELDGSAAAPDESYIQKALDHTHDNSRGDVDVLICHRMFRRALWEAQKGSTITRFTDTNQVVPGYLSGKTEDKHPDGSDYLAFDGRIPVIVDRYATLNSDADGGTYTGVMYGLDLETLFIALVTDFNWWAPEGRVLHRSDSRGFGVMADLYQYGNMVTDAPNRNFAYTADLSSVA